MSGMKLYNTRQTATGTSRRAPEPSGGAHHRHRTALIAGLSGSLLLVLLALSVLAIHRRKQRVAAPDTKADQVGLNLPVRCH
jgi:hypothetical protein